MRKILLLLLACCLFLCSCGKQLYLPEATNDKTFGIIGGADGPTSIIVGEPNDVLKTLKTKTHVGDGYTIEVPQKGWKYEKEFDDSALEETWEKGHAEFSVYTYNLPLVEARRAFLAEKDDYIIEDLMGETICGFDKGDGGRILWFRCYESGEKTIFLCWEYSALASDNSSILLSAIADTFTLK